MRDDPQRLTNTEQLEILTLLETASTERSAMRAARALAQLMRHLHALGQRIAMELPAVEETAGTRGNSTGTRGEVLGRRR